MAVVPSGNPSGTHPKKQGAFGNYKGFNENKVVANTNNVETNQSGAPRVLASPRFEPFKVFIDAFQDVASQ